MPWCKDRTNPLGHRFGPTSTFHWSPQYRVTNPRPLEADDVAILTAELVVGDEDGELGEASLFVQGLTGIDLSAPEADVFIVQMQAFVDTLRLLRGQMGARRVAVPRPDIQA